MCFVSLPVNSLIINSVSSFQAICQHGRDKIESWGRKKRHARSLGRGHVQETTKEAALAAAAAHRSDNQLPTVVSDSVSKEEMSISQEILVLDLGDEIEKNYKRQPSVAEPNPYYTNGNCNYCHS